MAFLGIFALLFATAIASPLAIQERAAADGFKVSSILTKNLTNTDELYIQFTVRDPVAAADETTSCNYTWASTAAYPQGAYQPCLNTNFAFNFESFTNTTDFTLQLEHLYEDPRTASGPVSSGGSSSGSVDDWNLVFGRVNITKHNLGCMTVATSDFECAQPLRSVIDAPYYAMV